MDHLKDLAQLGHAGAARLERGYLRGEPLCDRAREPERPQIAQGLLPQRLECLGIDSIELLKIFLKNLFEILVLDNLIEKYFLVLKSQKDFSKRFSIILLN